MKEQFNQNLNMLLKEDFFKRLALFLQALKKTTETFHSYATFDNNLTLRIFRKNEEDFQHVRLLSVKDFNQLSEIEPDFIKLRLIFGSKEVTANWDCDDHNPYIDIFLCHQIKLIPHNYGWFTFSKRFGYNEPAKALRYLIEKSPDNKFEERTKDLHEMFISFQKHYAEDFIEDNDLQYFLEEFKSRKQLSDWRSSDDKSADNTKHHNWQ